MVTGTLLVCPHCGDCVELLGEPPKPHEIENYRCDCGAVLEPVDEDPARRYARTVSALIVKMRGG